MAGDTSTYARPSVTVEAGPSGTIVRVSGNVDVHTAGDLRQALHVIIDQSDGTLLLDLSQAWVGDATGLGLLVECHRRGSRLGRELRLVAADERCMRMLRRLGLGRQFGPRAARAAT